MLHCVAYNPFIFWLLVVDIEWRRFQIAEQGHNEWCVAAVLGPL